MQYDHVFENAKITDASLVKVILNEVSKHNVYRHYETYPEVFDIKKLAGILAHYNQSIKPKKTKKIEYGGAVISMQSNRYVSWIKDYKSIKFKCCSCEHRGNYVLLQKSKDQPESNKYHMNLYSVIVSGQNAMVMMMTLDHILPKVIANSKGINPETIENYQLMCSQCNNLKSCRPVENSVITKEVSTTSNRSIKKNPKQAVKNFIMKDPSLLTKLDFKVGDVFVQTLKNKKVFHEITQVAKKRLFFVIKDESGSIVKHNIFRLTERFSLFVINGKLERQQNVD